VSGSQEDFAALVTEVHHRSTLAAVRDLGRAGVDVVAVGPSGAAGRLSRYATRSAWAPDPAADPLAHRAAVAAALGGRSSTVVYPGTEMSLDACLRPGDGSAAALRLPYARPASLATLRDKVEMARRATEAGLGAPGTLYDGPLSGVGAAALSLPYVVKQARPAATDVTTTVIREPGELYALVATGPEDNRVVAQQLVEGPLMSVALVLDEDGRVRAEFHQRGTRLWPAGAGSSSRAVGVPPQPAVTKAVAAFLQLAGYAGLAQLDYVATLRGPVVLDVNPRFYGSMPLAAASGVNLPLAWHASVCGAPYSPPAAYREGVTFRWLEADLSDVRHGDRQALRATPRPRVGAVWDCRDPLPSVRVAAEAVGRVLGARLRPASVANEP
jgi:predicted ATP-grasp superfamily ATP-dependent carboligase